MCGDARDRSPPSLAPLHLASALALAAAENATSDFFIPAFAKVTECIELGRYDNIVNPGDIILDLYGTPAG